jgi:hypothetical protein
MTSVLVQDVLLYGGDTLIAKASAMRPFTGQNDIWYGNILSKK